jgi:hypothetical protein
MLRATSVAEEIRVAERLVRKGLDTYSDMGIY